MMAPSSLSKKRVMTPMTDQELDAVTIVFHQFETGLREGTIYTKVSHLCSFVEILNIWLCKIRTYRQAHIYIVAKTKLDLNYISINCHHILPTIRPLLWILFLNIHVLTNCDKIAWFKGSNFFDNSTLYLKIKQKLAIFWFSTELHRANESACFSPKTLPEVLSLNKIYWKW